MSVLKHKCLALVLGLSLSALMVNCDDEKKMVCCWCECSQPVGSGDVNTKTDTVSGMGISCKSACNTLCQRESRWELSNYANVNCNEIDSTNKNSNDEEDEDEDEEDK